MCHIVVSIPTKKEENGSETHLNYYALTICLNSPYSTFYLGKHLYLMFNLKKYMSLINTYCLWDFYCSFLSSYSVLFCVFPIFFSFSCCYILFLLLLLLFTIFFLQYKGFIMYRHILKRDYKAPTTLTSNGIRDRAIVMVNSVSELGVLNLS